MLEEGTSWRRSRPGRPGWAPARPCSAGWPRRRPATAGTAAGAAVAGPAAQPGVAAGPGGRDGWRHYRVPVKGQANLDAAAAPGRDYAWAGGFTIKQQLVGSRAAGVAGRLRLSRLTAPGRARSGGDRAGPAAAGLVPAHGFLDTLLLRWNGRTWSRVAAPDVARINYLSAASPSSAWASGDCGLLGWNGRSWRLASFPMPPASLQPAPGNVVDVSADDAWLLGSTLDVSQNILGSFVDHWNGRRWQSVTLPAALHLGSGTTLTAIGAQGPARRVDRRDAPVGSPSSLRTKIVLLHWNGRSWQRLAQPASGLGYYNSVQGVRVVSATSAWVVGWDKLGPNENDRRLPLALHWNGRRWTTTRMPAGRGELENVTRRRRAGAGLGRHVLARPDLLRPGPAALDRPGLGARGGARLRAGHHGRDRGHPRRRGLGDRLHRR